jgi:hypothetical protein
MEVFKAKHQLDEMSSLIAKKGLSNKKVLRALEVSFKDNLLYYRKLFINYEILVKKYYLLDVGHRTNEIQSHIELISDCNKNSEVEEMFDLIEDVIELIGNIFIVIDDLINTVQELAILHVDGALPKDLSYYELLDKDCKYENQYERFIFLKGQDDYAKSIGLTNGYSFVGNHES